MWRAKRKSVVYSMPFLTVLVIISLSSNQDFIQEFTFGLVQFSSATHMAATYANVTSTNISSLPPGDILKLDLTASGTIPQEPDAYINSVLGFGYGWLDSTTFPSNAVTATIHPQLNDGNLVPNMWHTHSIVVNSDGCISELNQLPGGVIINGQTISVITPGATSPVNATNFQSAISFETVMDSTTCPSPMSGLKAVK